MNSREIVFDVTEADWYPVKLSDGSEALYPAAYRPKQMPDGSYWYHAQNGLHIATMPLGATFFDQVYFPYLDDYPNDFRRLDDAMNAVLWQAMVHSPWNHTQDDGFWETLRKNTLRLRSQTNRALVIVCGCNLFEWGTFLRRIDNFLMDIYSVPDEVEYLLDALMERHLATLEKVCDTVGDIVDILRFGDDLGMDSGPFMSPEIYQKLFKPRHTKLNEYVHFFQRRRLCIQPGA